MHDPSDQNIIVSHRICDVMEDAHGTDTWLDERRLGHRGTRDSAMKFNRFQVNQRLRRINE